jgi:hypothetical protein
VRAARARVAAAVLAVAGLWACATARLGGDEAARVAGRYEQLRWASYAPRRFKALFSGEVSRGLGVARGYLSVFWDGSTLSWQTSAPLSGGITRGTLGLDTEPGGGNALFPGSLTARDAVGALLGVLDLPAADRPVDRRGGRLRLHLDDDGRIAVLDDSGRVIGLEFPGGVSVRFEPGEGVPRRIDASGKSGRASLKLESLAPWPEGEPVPGASS